MGLGGGGLEGLTSQSGGGAGGSAVSGLGIWRFRTETSAPPASGQLRFNNSDIESATVLFLHETNADGTDMANFLEQLGVGSFLYIQDRSASENFILVQISSNTDNGVYRSFGIDIVEQQGDKPSQNSEVGIVATGDPSPTPSISFPSFQFEPLQLDDPNNADWAVNAVAPAVGDVINAALTVRRFDSASEEGVGFMLEVPAGATNIVFGFLSRAISPQPTPNNVGVNIYNRGIPDGSPVQSWSAGDQLTDIALPNNTNFVKDSESVTLASLGITAGETTQFELTRVAPTGGNNQFGDWALLQLTIGFS
jgi:hypothetical protein